MPLLNEIHKLIEKFIIDIPEDEKSREWRLKVISTIVEAIAKGSTEAGIDKVKDSM